MKRQAKGRIRLFALVAMAYIGFVAAGLLLGLAARADGPGAQIDARQDRQDLRAAALEARADASDTADAGQDARIDALAQLIHRLQSDVAALTARVEALEADQPTDPVEPPDPPAGPAIDLTGLPATVAPGDTLAIPTPGLAGRSLNVHWWPVVGWEGQASRPLVAERVMAGETITIVVPDVAGLWLQVQTVSGEPRISETRAVAVQQAAPQPDPDPGDLSAIPADLRDLPATAFVAGRQWRGDHRFVDVQGSPWANTWGDWCASGDRGRLYIDGGKLSHGIDPPHRGQPFKGWSEYYFRGVEFRGLQWATESNAGTKRGAMIDCDFYDVREDAIRDIAGHIENVTIHSANLLPGAHGDTIDWKTAVDGAVIKNLRSETGVLNGIITADVKNIVIDGYIHRGHPDHLSIDIGGDAENAIIRNCKLSGGIRFRGKQTNVKIEWDTVRTNVKDW